MLAPFTSSAKQVGFGNKIGELWRAADSGEICEKIFFVVFYVV